jgi:hypothetical protein
MSAPANRWKLGLFVVVGTAALFTGLTWIGMARLQRATHEAFLYLDEPVLGLEPGSPAKFRGVPIGVVAGLRLAPDRRHLEVRLRLFDDALIGLGLDPASFDPDHEMPPGLHGQIVTSYLTQTSFVLMDYFLIAPEHEQRLPFTPPPNTVRAVRSTFRNVEEGLRDFLRELPGMTAEASKLLRQAREAVESSRIPELSKRADDVLAAAERKVRDLDQIPVVQAATGAFREVEALTKAWRDDKGPVQTLLVELRQLSTDLRTAIGASNLPATAKSLRDAGDASTTAGQNLGVLASDLRGELPYLRSALAAIERLVDLLQRDPSALLHGRTPSDSPLKKQ